MVFLCFRHIKHRRALYYGIEQNLCNIFDQNKDRKNLIMIEMKFFFNFFWGCINRDTHTTHNFNNNTLLLAQFHSLPSGFEELLKDDKQE